MYERRERPFMRHAAFNAFRHELALRFARLAVTIFAAFLHRAERPHAAIGFERAALIENDLAGTLIRAGEQRADHHGISAGGDGFSDVARILDAAVGDDRHT